MFVFSGSLSWTGLPDGLTRVFQSVIIALTYALSSGTGLLSCAFLCLIPSLDPRQPQTECREGHGGQQVLETLRQAKPTSANRRGHYSGPL